MLMKLLKMMKMMKYYYLMKNKMKKYVD